MCSWIPHTKSIVITVSQRQKVPGAQMNIWDEEKTQMNSWTKILNKFSVYIAADQRPLCLLLSNCWGKRWAASGRRPRGEMLSSR